MKKTSKLLLSTALLATIAGGVVAPLPNVFGPQVVYAVDGSPEIPASTKVIIHKLQADSYNDDVTKNGGIENKDGAEIDYSSLGQNVRPLAGVIFRYFKVTDDKTKDELKKMSKEDLEKAYPGSKTLRPTDDQGVVVWNVAKDENARYWVIEDDAPSTVSSSVAVPFEISFPMAASNGTGYLNEVNIYPKNISSEPVKPGKDVEKLGNNDASYKIGDTINFILKGSIPTNIQDYEQYDLVDTFDSQLTPDTNSISVTFGTNTLTLNTDYKVNTEGKRVTVALTPAGIAKIAAAVPVANRDKANIDGEGSGKEATENTNDAPFIQVNIQAKINSSAKLITDINNQTTINYDNKKDGKKTPKPTEPSRVVKVYTGGATFVKVDAQNTQTKLAGAEFDLLDAEGKAVVWTEDLITANKAAEGQDNAGKFTGEITPGAPIKLKSGADGTFAIAGLAYGTEVTKRAADGSVTETATSAAARKYQLKETKAPEGYVIPTENIPFEISPSSTTDVTAIELKSNSEKDNPVKNNKRPAIPNTGGIGSVIFVVAGLAAMVLAVFGMKKRNNKEA